MAHFYSRFLANGRGEKLRPIASNRVRGEEREEMAGESSSHESCADEFICDRTDANASSPAIQCHRGIKFKREAIMLRQPLESRSICRPRVWKSRDDRCCFIEKIYMSPKKCDINIFPLSTLQSAQDSTRAFQVFTEVLVIFFCRFGVKRNCFGINLICFGLFFMFW